MEQGINHGLVIEEIVPDEHYILGSYGNLGGEIINPSRDWRSTRPSINEVQNKNGIEPFACTNFGTDNAEETLLKYQYGIEVDYSDRWFAKKSGTNTTAQGNSPHVVAEFRRKNGVVLEKDWRFDETIKTVEDFYADPPKKLDTLANVVVAEYEFKHEWVTPTAKALYDALQYSPLGFSVFAWTKDENGYYYKPKGAIDGHWVCCLYAEWGKYWLILDSYADNGELLKKVRWDALPLQAKRYKITRQVVNETAFTKFLNLIRAILGI